MEVDVAPETRAALEADRTLRCLYKTKFDLDSRSPRVAIPWAHLTAEMVTKVILSSIGYLPEQSESSEHKKHQEQPGHGGESDRSGHEEEPIKPQSLPVPYSVNVLLIRLGRRERAFICFDIFLEGCDEQTRNSIGCSFVQPIHFISGKGNKNTICRNRGLDHNVGEQYRYRRTRDEGPLPLFVDTTVTMVYDGKRRLDPEELEEYKKAWALEEASELEGDAAEDEKATDSMAEDRGEQSL